MVDPNLHYTTRISFKLNVKENCLISAASILKTTPCKKVLPTLKNKNPRLKTRKFGEN